MIGKHVSDCNVIISVFVVCKARYLLDSVMNRSFFRPRANTEILLKVRHQAFIVGFLNVNKVRRLREV